MSPTRSRHENGEDPRLQGDAGAILVEFALVLPLLISLVLGILEFGTVHRNETLIAGALRAAGRVESQSRNSTTPNLSADLYALTTYNSTATKSKSAQLVRVIVYLSSTADGKVPASCLAASFNDTGPNGVSGVCNVYSPNMVASAANGLAVFKFGCTTSTNWDWKWCVNTRDASLNAAAYVGIYSEYQYTNVTKILPYSTMKLTDYVVYRMEPTV